jgi:hypothetical protein
MTADAKRAHYVPVGYLRPWVDGSNQVAVRRRGSSGVFTPNIINISVEAGLYGRGPAGSARENMFGQIEHEWPGLREALSSDGGLIPSPTRQAVSVFAALQLVRTREHVAQTQFLTNLARFSSERPVQREDVRAYLEEHHLRFAPTDSEVEGAWTIASATLNHSAPPSAGQVLSMSLDIAIRKLGPRLAQHRWSVEHCAKPILFTSDRPVMCWRPRSGRDAYEGIGIETADEIRLPLSPQDLLVMRPTGIDEGVRRVQAPRFERVNAAVASQCHEFVVGRRGRADHLKAIQLAEHRPSLRFNFGPGFRHLPDGREQSIGDIVHMWVPTHV